MREDAFLRNEVGCCACWGGDVRGEGGGCVEGGWGRGVGI